MPRLRRAAHGPVLRHGGPPLREGLRQRDDTDEQRADEQLGRVLRGQRRPAVRARPPVRPRVRARDEGRELPRRGAGGFLGGGFADGDQDEQAGSDELEVQGQQSRLLAYWRN